MKHWVSDQPTSGYTRVSGYPIIHGVSHLFKNMFTPKTGEMESNLRSACGSNGLVKNHQLVFGESRKKSYIPCN